MASLVDQSKEDKIKDLLEEIDLHKFIRDDLLSAMGECEEVAEVRETIRSKEIQLAELLGDPIPAPQAAPTPPVVSPTPPTLTSTPVPPHIFSGIPGDSFSTPHWPSAAPSPFAAASRTPVQTSAMLPASPVLPSPDNSRKRPRPTSEFSPTLQSSSKRNAASQPESRKSKLEEIDARQAEELAAHNRQYERLMHAAMDGSEVDDLRKERDDIEKDIISEFQLERDAELARALQYEENNSQLPMANSRPHASWNIPDRTQPVKLEPGSNGFRTPQPYGPILPSYQRDDFGSDDGFEEISADSFNSRFGRKPAHYSMSVGNPHVQYQYPSQYSKAQYTPTYSPYPDNSYPSTVSGARSLPWMHKPAYAPPMLGPMLGGMPSGMPGSYDQFDKAFDLVRDQQEIFDDENDIAYVHLCHTFPCFQF